MELVDELLVLVELELAVFLTELDFELAFLLELDFWLTLLEPAADSELVDLLLWLQPVKSRLAANMIKIFPFIRHPPFIECAFCAYIISLF